MVSEDFLLLRKIGVLSSGPFIKLGPLRNVPEVAETAGVLSAAGLVVILTLWCAHLAFP